MPRKKNNELRVEEEIKDVDIDTTSDETASEEMTSDETETNEVQTNEVEKSNSEPSEAAQVSDDELDAEAPKVKEPKLPTRQSIVAQKRIDEKKREERNAIREARLMAWEQIKNAKHENQIVNGTVVGVEAMEKDVVAVIIFGEFRVIVPFSEMYVNNALDDKADSSEESKIYRKTQMLQKLLGAEIPFVITHYTGTPVETNELNGEYAIIASRKRAIQRIAARNFNIRKQEGRARINAGDTVSASIISVGMHGVFVNVAGVDISIPTYLLTYQYAPDCRELYRAGDKIDIYIYDVERDNDGKFINLRASAKTAEIPKFIPRLKRIMPNMRCQGTITSIRLSKTVSGRTVVLLYLEAFKVPAIATFTQMDAITKPLLTGDKVIFSIHEVKEDRGIVTGTIIQRI